MNDAEARLRARDVETPNNPEIEYELFKVYHMSEVNLADKYLTLACDRVQWERNTCNEVLFRSRTRKDIPRHGALRTRA